MDKGPCLVCKGNHDTLWYCLKLPSFLPEKGGSVNRLPAAMCKICLKTKSWQPNSCHKKDSWFMCKKHNVSKFLCDCAIYAQMRAWLIKSFDPTKGFNNLRTMSKELGIVLSNRIVVPKVNVGAMKLNDCFIGGSHCPSEVISMRKDDSMLFHVKLHYDTAASHCLANELIKPIIVEETKSTFPIQLSTINSTTCALRTLATVKVNDTKFSCILVKSMHVDSHTMPIPSVWEQYHGNWIEQDTDDHRMLPQILVGN